MYLEDGNFRRIARLLGVHHQTVINWVNASHAALKERGTTPPQPDTVETAELDELWTFVGSKKTVLPRDARLSRKNRCFTRCEKALERAVWLFALAWNTRQLHNRKYPKYKKHLIEGLPALR